MYIRSVKLLVAIAAFSFCLSVSARAIHALNPEIGRTARDIGSREPIYNSNDHPSSRAKSVRETFLDFPEVSDVDIEKRDQQLSWAEAVQKGRALWANLQRYIALDNPPAGIKYPGRRLKRYETIVDNTNARPPNVMVAPLESDGVNTRRGWEYIDVRQDNVGTSNYKNYYYFDTALQKGVILADHQTRGANALLPWSEVAFQQYKAFPGSVLSRLRYIYRVTISTTSTLVIMEEAVRRREYQKRYEECGDTWYGFRPGNPPSESFLALLGSKNGRGVAHMLIDHCAELGKKSIKEIQVNLDISSMKFVLTS